jgi:transcriptional regulator with GAF, ATPase, and Fis domain
MNFWWAGHERNKEIKIDDFLKTFSKYCGGEKMTLRQARHAWERGFILEALRTNGWNQSRTAEELGTHRNNLALKIKRYKLRTFFEKHSKGREKA